MTEKKRRKISLPTNVKWDELEKGIKLVLDNAQRLNSDGEVLLRNKRFPSSRFLVLVAKEEIGKAYLLADLWAGKRDVSDAEYRKIFKSRGAHERKLSASGRAFLKTDAWQNLGDLFAEQEQDFKEKSLYVDYQQSVGFGFWTTPTKDAEEEQEWKESLGLDLKKLRHSTNAIDELFLSDQLKRNSSAISSLRTFLKEQAKILPSTPAPAQPVIVAPARQPPVIRVAEEFTVDYLLNLYEECLKMLARQDIKELPSWRPSSLPSLSYPVPTLEKLQADVNIVPSQRGKKALVLYHLASLRTNLFLELHDKTETLGHQNGCDVAVELMNEYATKVAIPFARESALDRATRATRNLRAVAKGRMPYFPRQWRTRYQNWARKKKSFSTDQRLKAYLDLEYTFSMLHAMSFSSANSPKLGELTHDELNQFLVTGHFP